MKGIIRRFRRVQISHVAHLPQSSPVRRIYYLYSSADRRLACTAVAAAIMLSRVIGLIVQVTRSSLVGRMRIWWVSPRLVAHNDPDKGPNQ